jgi:hypothetical protein
MRAKIISIVLALPAIAFAQPGRLAPLEATTLKADLQAGNLLNALTKADTDCDALLRESRRKTEKVSDRAARAREALECVQSVSSYAVALAPSERAFQLRELFKPLHQTYEANLKQAESEEKFLGLTWGVGLGYSFGRDRSVDEAEIVGGVVRIKSEQKQQPRLLMEFHKYFWCNSNDTDGTRGCGPFVAAAATSDKVLSGVGLGFMYGMKSKATDSEGFSVGLGAVLDAKVKDLAEGFKPNEAAPAGETTVRYTTKSRWSILLFVTRTF